MPRGSLVVVGTGIQLRAHMTLEAQQWIEVADWIPERDHQFWIGPGRFDLKGGAKSAIRGLFVDKVELIRVVDTVMENGGLSGGQTGDEQGGGRRESKRDAEA